MGSIAGPDAALFTAVEDWPPEDVIFGNSLVMVAIRQNLQETANANIPVLLEGQSGTGKEVLAKVIHRRSPWGCGPFVKVNCPAIPGTLLESELFGYETGALAGACGSRPGPVQPAHRGTLFLDEIAELDRALQAKLLQLLQDGQFCRIGAQEEKRLEVRVVCATNRQLQHETGVGAFRQDLFYRINIVTMQLPPLRERRGDIPLLTNYFLETYSKKYGSEVPPLSNRLIGILQRHHWPGNIRELENLIKRYVILGSEADLLSSLQSADQNYLNPEIPRDGVFPLKKVVRKAAKQLERKIILGTLETNRWNRKMTARALSISYAALLYKMREAGVPAIRGPRAGQPVAALDDGMN
ncbi:MAG: sigma-54-dependent Fis family transcriptional regulator [Acidobacteria bacterium]|nr:sigma-54-dependent Fis family transcriptional regulator [Acidobacteriota bacterium]